MYKEIKNLSDVTIVLVLANRESEFDIIIHILPSPLHAIRVEDTTDLFFETSLWVI